MKITKAHINKIVRVKWLDACSHNNVSLQKILSNKKERERLKSYNETIGKLAYSDDTMTVIVTTWDFADRSSEIHDIVMIPTGWVEHIVEQSAKRKNITQVVKKHGQK